MRGVFLKLAVVELHRKGFFQAKIVYFEPGTHIETAGYGSDSNADQSVCARK